MEINALMVEMDSAGANLPSLVMIVMSAKVVTGDLETMKKRVCSSKLETIKKRPGSFRRPLSRSAS